MPFTPKRILITNDDGIYAPGLKLLEDIASEMCTDIWVVAPRQEQSGASHSLTLHYPLRMAEYGDQKYAVEGTPTDCVLMALKHIMPEPPDLILSGINFGQNIADDVTYSGTVAAAMEGTALGIPSIALSQTMIYEDDFTPDWRASEGHCLTILEQLLDIDWPQGTLMNVNFPACGADEVTGIEITEQGKRNQGLLWIDERQDGRQHNYYWISFRREKSNPPAGTDMNAVYANKISITPLQMNLTHKECLDDLRHRFSAQHK